MTGRCATCRYWAADDLLAELYHGPIGECMKVAEAWPNRSVDVLAFAVGYDDEAALRTRPTFGCIQWEPTS